MASIGPNRNELTTVHTFRATNSLYRSKVENESMLHLPQRTLVMLRRRKNAMGPGYSHVFPALKDMPRGYATDAIHNHIENVWAERRPAGRQSDVP